MCYFGCFLRDTVFSALAHEEAKPAQQQVLAQRRTQVTQPQRGPGNETAHFMGEKTSAPEAPAIALAHSGNK